MVVRLCFRIVAIDFATSESSLAVPESIAVGDDFFESSLDGASRREQPS
jgi:hypothetical protein